MNTLSFDWLRRPGKKRVGRFGGSQTERRHLDFLVDGSSLFEATGAQTYDLIGLLGWAGHALDRTTVERLLLEIPTDLWDDRQQIFVCAECGGIGCGGITARVSHSNGAYTWQDFAHENNYDPSMTERERFKTIGPFIFAENQYRSALLSVLDRHGSEAPTRIDV